MKQLNNKVKFVRYKEGAEIYGVSLRRFQDLAKEACAVYKIGKIVLINCEILDQYIETFKC